VDINKIVQKLIKKHGTNNPFEIADGLNIKVFYEPLGNVKGFYQSCPKNKIIHINEELDDINKLIVCSHELGHAILHSKLNIVFIERNTFYVKSRYESEANKFASELLIPQNLLDNHPEYFSVDQIAASINMPVDLIKLKFYKFE
jgi:Zn-dependent peptidase ImmA (M78 family)